MIDLCSHSEITRRTDRFRVTFGRYAPSTTIGRHDHERASLCVALSGGYDERLDRRDRRVDPGTLLVHPAGEAHANRHDPRPTDLLTIEFDSAALELARQISPAFNESWEKPAQLLLPSIYRLFHYIDGSCASLDVAIEDIVWLIIAEAVGYEQRDAGRPAWLRQVRDYLEAASGPPPLLADLAEMAGVHPVHLARAFRQAFGCSVGDFVIRRQVASALRLLTDASVDLAELSLIVGFADQSHMTRRMRTVTGRPPGAWRKRLADPMF